MQRPSSIVGLGGCTPVGLQAFPSAVAVHAGVSRVQQHPYIVDREGDAFSVAMNAGIDAHGRVARMEALVERALTEVLRVLPDLAQPISLFLALPEVNEFASASELRRLCSALSATAHAAGVQLTVTPVNGGNAAGVIALQRALAVAHGQDELVLWGGVDSFVDPDLLESLDAAHRVVSSANRWGFVPGEGAAVLAISTQALARGYRLPALASIASVVVEHEPKAMFTDEICIGEGLARCLKRAIDEAGAPAGRQFCDIDGERYREHEFSYAVARLHPSLFLDALDYVSAVSAWGHCGAATAPLLVMLATGLSARGFGGPTRPLVWCGSEQGNRGAIVLEVQP